MRKQTFIPSFATRFFFVKLTLGRMPIFTRLSRASTFQIIFARFSDSDIMNTFFFFSSTHTDHVTGDDSEGMRTLCSDFAHDRTFMSSLSNTGLFFYSIFDHDPCFNSPVSGVKVSKSKFLIHMPLRQFSFQFLIVGYRYFLINLHVGQFQYCFELRGLTYSQFVKTFQNTSAGIFDMDSRTSFHFVSNPEYYQHEK